MNYKEGVFKDFRFRGAHGNIEQFRCYFEIGLNPYEIREHLDEIREWLATLCNNYALLGSIVVAAEAHEYPFATAEELKERQGLIWRYVAIC